MPMYIYTSRHPPMCRLYLQPHIYSWRSCFIFIQLNKERKREGERKRKRRVYFHCQLLFFLDCNTNTFLCSKHLLMVTFPFVQTFISKVAVRALPSLELIEVLLCQSPRQVVTIEIDDELLSVLRSFARPRTRLDSFVNSRRFFSSRPSESLCDGHFLFVVGGTSRRHSDTDTMTHHLRQLDKTEVR